ncbi:hypothetical protein AYO40_01905 [Planctomycetaceae bacterium SCGC AG-212-D15]|nr:hypothetical protein AYO40_01905 [Planctomycetaceae bacterium SCGC AG-212-D15]
MGESSNGLTSAECRPTAVRWRIVALLMAYAFFCHINRISMSVAGTERIMGEYQISETQMGYVYSAYLLIYTFCMTPGGWLIDRRGARTALLLMGFGSAVFVMLTGVTGLVLTGALVLPALLVIRALLGAVSAPIHPAAARGVSLWVPAPARSGANALVTGAALLGIASTYILFGNLMDRIGWPWAFIVCGIATALLAGFWLDYAADRPGEHPSVNRAEQELIEASEPWPDEPRNESRELPSLFSNRSLMLLTISYGAINYFEYLFFYWMQYYFEKVLGVSKDDGRTYSTILTLAMAGGIFAGGWLADRLQRRFGPRLGRGIVPVAGLFASAAFLWLGLLSREVWLIVTLLSLAMAAVGACEGPVWTTAVELGGRRGGTAAAICNTGGNAGGLLAPVITPLVSQWYDDWRLGFGLASFFCLFGAVLWLGIHPATPAKE